MDWGADCTLGFGLYWCKRLSEGRYTPSKTSTKTVDKTSLSGTILSDGLRS